MHAQSHRSDARILGRRTLEQDHRRLVELLRPGLSVLDVGCGVGSITAGIAEAVGPTGHVVGIDRDAAHVESARARYGHVAHLRFELGDATSLEFHGEFDIVTAARTLQWIADPRAAVSRMTRAAKRDGVVVVLDYNHAENAWSPEPPREFRAFYQAFLNWRAARGWDNQMARNLPALFSAAGLVEVETSIEDEVVERDTPGFEEKAKIWSEVIENLRTQLRDDGFCSEDELRAAGSAYTRWVAAHLQRQTLVLRAVTGRVP
ncbi:methyltransferase domain-containing protein [uncultured Paludibaculum sp.]|uniref:methyltransferase domain-containing protein n=1 Tax=uncultured Paludibaculum sp. TaxID=1765020 RepID=UPI002AABFF00|nr:methyltransferase domain-containing protein [uncultured Paludibaculum sp.]